MCGIIAVSSDNAILSKKIAETSLKKIQHRGPDNSAIFSDNNISLGSCRLSIFDLSNDANMTMQDATGRYTITYNGEIYDISSLKSNITKPVNTSNDTIHLLDFLTENENKINDINGMFSFAFYNSRKKLLTIARDRLGVKPIYYSIDKDGYIVFSSELLIALG